MNNSLHVRYSKKQPLLKYIVPFSYGHNGKSYSVAKQQVIDTNEWKTATRKDIVPSHEEDLYDHIYCSIIENNNGLENNIGITFIPLKSKNKEMIYVFYDNGKEFKINFTITYTNLYLFKTGIGFYCYEIMFDESVKNKMDIKNFILFQNRIKELNVLRGFYQNGDSHYLIYPSSFESNNNSKIPYYTLGVDIAKELDCIFEDVFYYPPRINEILKLDKKQEISNRWNEKRLELENKGIGSNQKKYKRIKLQFDQEWEYWDSISLYDINKSDSSIASDIIKIVPDKAILYNYVVFETDKEVESEEEKNILINELCTNAYYLTRGYKHSYKVSPTAVNERSHMFERHENDFWDAALEGAGDFVMLYDNIYNNENNEKYNHFFDEIRAKEMRGDYFILYILLLYQHYSIVFYSKKISELIPGQSKSINEFIENDDEVVFKKLKKLKNDLDLFLSNSMFESIGQITDVCTIYSYIEEKLNIKKNLETLRQSVNSINSLCEGFIDENSKKREESINKLISTFGFLANFTIAMDAISLLSWFKDDLIKYIIKIFNIPYDFENIVNISYILLSLISLVLVFILNFKAIRLFYKYKKQKI